MAAGGGARAEKGVKDRVLDRLSLDLPACDCLVTLFHSALVSYRYETVLKPFPSEYILEDSNKDIEGLRAILDTLPSLDQLSTQDTLNNKFLSLLDWLFNGHNFVLRSLPLSKFADIEKETIGSTHTVKPYAIFELEYNTEQDSRWRREVVKEHDTFLAYHGTRVENLYCISHIGLLSHMNKVGIYGEGTYLSTDLGVCMNFSPSATVWKHSRLPAMCSMVAVCEVVDTPEIRSRVQVGGEPSLNQKIPERYFVVTNNELLRLKYILVFAQQVNSTRRNAPPSWINKHKWLLMIVLYITLLLLIGMYNSRYFANLYRHYTRKHITL